MTEFEIDALPAGPEMDRLIRDRGLPWCETPNPGPTKMVSTDAGVSLEALERFVESSKPNRVTYRLRRTLLRAPFDVDILVFDGEDALIGEANGSADTLALAICRALAKAGKLRE